MLKVLIKKQFKECFKNYFVNSKTGKAKSKTAIIGMFALFAILLIILGVSFFAIATTLYDLLNTEYRWLYYAVFAVMTIGLGTFASVFNTSSSLYNAKDNDLLLSMPIKPSHILLSRVTLVYGLSILYSTLVWIPICIYVFFAYKFSVVSLILDILLLFVINAFTSVLACLLGYIIATITRKIKNKSIMTVILSLSFLGVYYWVCFKLQNILESIIINKENLANIFSTWGYLVYQLALAADGNVLSFILITLVNGLLSFLCYKLLLRNYTNIITSSKNIQTKTNKIRYSGRSSLDKTLLTKELKRFVGNPLYLLNCGLGCLLVVVAGVATIIKKNDIVYLVETLQSFLPEANAFIPLIIIGIICLIISVDGITVPSISLEGKQLWILKSLPIDTFKILNAKISLQVLVNTIPAIISCLLMAYTFGLSLSTTLNIVIIIFYFEEIHACVGIMLGLINPNFTWTSEVQPIKQDLMVLAGLVLSLIITAAIVVPYYFFKDNMAINDYLRKVIIITMVVAILLVRIIRKWGVRRFESL